MEWVLVGDISVPFGVRGEVKVSVLLDDPKHLKHLPGVLIRWEGGAEETRRVTAVRQHQGINVLAFEGIADRDQAERLRRAQIFVRQDELPPLEEDSFYDWQLVGLQVVTDSGRTLGRIEKVYFYPANDVYETPDALIPGVASVVIKVSLERGEMLVRDIPGLLKRDF